MSATTSGLEPFEALAASEFAFTRRAWVDAAPARVYELVSDVSAISRWSPNTSDVAYDHGAGPSVGAWFSGRNRRDGREWTTRSQVVRADPPDCVRLRRRWPRERHRAVGLDIASPG
ncbi:SRPBCC family protein [Streptomyces sp. NPDC056462]|uniref:SRPBCC family protein n=1 Tax=Streptomyces sp. NPDC056462 TaxID=3345826 RepID=UPI00367A0514